MNNMTMETEKSSRKKLLVPLVVLLLCAVSLTGAAYAYNATLNVNGNSANAGYLSIDLTNQNDIDSNITVTSTQIVEFTDHFDYSKSANTWVKTDQVAYELTTGNLVGYDVTVARDNQTAVKLTIEITGLASKSMTINGVSKTLAQIYKFNVTVGSTTVTATEADDGTLTAVFNSVAVGSTTATIALELEDGITVSGNVTATPVASTAEGYKTASQYQTAFGNTAFTVNFKVEPTA